MVLKELTSRIIDNSSNKEIVNKCLEEYKSVYNDAKKVCIKNAHITEKDKKLWFSLLADLYETWQKMNHDKEVASNLETRNLLGSVINDINICIKELLDKMLEYIPFELVIAEVMENNAELELEGFKEMFNSMLISYLFQGKILETADKIIGNHLFYLTSSLIDYKTKAVTIENPYCDKCKSHISPEKYKNFFIFRCGHTFALAFLDFG